MSEILHSLSLEKKIGQLFFIGISGPEVDDRTRALIDEISPGGVCLFARNIRSDDQTRQLLDEIRAVSMTAPLLSVDQEGGLVDRLRRIMTPMPAASRIRDAESAARLAELIAKTLRLLGFNMDFAPVVDVIDNERASYNNGLFSRGFGTTKEETAALAGAFLQTLQANGIVGCVKHFPGLGASQVDSHEELPVVGITADELSGVDLYPYRELIGSGAVHAVMVAHASYPHHRLQATDKHGKLLPSSLSHDFVTNLLRDELRFDGLVITDDLEMGAIIKNYGIGEACRLSVHAGVDMLAVCADEDRIREGYSAVLSAVRAGDIPEDRIDASLSRIAAVKDRTSLPPPFDAERLSGLSAEISRLAEECQ